jgi:segregation and condensation protein B
LSEPAADLPPDDEKKAARQLDRAIRDEIRALVDELIADYNTPDSGLEIREVAGGFRIGTRPEYHDAVRAFIKTLKPPLKLSLQALETLAVIAYKQPVTAPEIGEIRGVDASGVLGSLIARKLITTAGRKQVVGRPILYKTTKEFLLRFGLNDVNELPSIEEFEKMASELAEPEEEGAVATEEKLPFAQNEIAEIEDAVDSSSEDDLEAADPAPTSESDVAEQPK